MEKVVSQQPEKAEFLFELAGLYALNGNKAKEERVYDKILQLDPRSIVALTSKATLRNAQGDKETAQTLFTKAEEVAPTEPLKAQIRKMANDALSQPTPNPQ
jgi:Flp pilus assembly protein TadD